MAGFDSLAEGDISDIGTANIAPVTSMKQTEETPTAELTPREKAAQSLANTESKIKELKGKKGYKKKVSKLQTQAMELRKFLNKPGEDTAGEVTSESAPDTSKPSILKKLGTVFEDKVETDPTVEAGGGGDGEAAAENSDARVKGLDEKDRPGVSPMPDYIPPDTVKEAQANPVAEDNKFGGVGSIAQSSGFDEKFNQTDLELQESMDDIARKKGIIAVIQGLGMAAAGWYGLHNNVDMSTIKFDQKVNFDAEEEAVLDKARFRRKQLLQQQNDQIRRQERGEDISRKSAERAEDITIRKNEKDKSAAEREAQRKLAAKAAKVQENNDNYFKQANLDLNNNKLTAQKLKVAAKASESLAKKSGNSKDADSAEYKNQLATWKDFDEVVKKPDSSFEMKKNAIEKVLDQIIKINPEVTEKINVLRTEALKDTGGWFSKDISTEGFREKLRDTLKGDNIYYSVTRKRLDEQEMASIKSSAPAESPALAKIIKLYMAANKNLSREEAKRAAILKLKQMNRPNQ